MVWAYRILSESYNVVLLNPLKTKVIASAKVKTDNLNVFTVVNLLRGRYIAESYVPSSELLQLKKLVMYRAELLKMRNNLKSNIHAVLLMYNIRIEGHPFINEYINRFITIITFTNFFHYKLMF